MTQSIYDDCNIDSPINQFIEFVNTNFSDDIPLINCIIDNVAGIDTVSNLCEIPVDTFNSLDFVISFDGYHLTRNQLAKRRKNLLVKLQNMITSYSNNNGHNINQNSNGNNNNNNNNNDGQQWREYIDKEIREKHLTVDKIKRILRTNGIRPNGIRQQLIQQLYNNTSINMNVLTQPPVNRGARNSNNNINENINENQNDDSSQHVEEKRNYNEEYLRRMDRDNCYQKILQLISVITKVIEDLEKVIEIPSELYEQFEEATKLAEEIEELYRRVPRRFRNQAPSEYIESRKDRIKRFNNIAPKLLAEVAKLARQTRGLLALCYANSDTLGVDKRSKPKIWISPMCNTVNFEASMDLVGNFKSIYESFVNDRSSFLENHKINQLQLIIKILLKTAIESDADQVLDKAKQMNLGDFISKLIDDGQNMPDLPNQIDDEDDEEMLQIMNDLDDSNDHNHNH